MAAEVAKVEPKSTGDIIKLLGIGAVSVAINYLIFKKLLKPAESTSKSPRKLKKELMNEIITRERSEIDLMSSKKELKGFKK